MVAYSKANEGVVEQYILFGGTAEELSSSSGVRSNAVCLRYGPSNFTWPVGSNKPSEWEAAIQALLYVETTGGLLDRKQGYRELLSMVGTCVAWQEQLDPANSINVAMSDFYATQTGAIIDDRPRYYAMTMTFNSTICIQ